ncbi:MAG: LPD25 domain-containing protein, partial [Ruminococcus sp.]
MSPTLTVSYLSLFSDSKGIRLTNSKNGAKQLINWKKAAVIISDLIKADRYFNSAEKSGYIEYKSSKAAKSSTAENKALKVSNENRQAHYKVGDKCYIGADEYKITDISENTVTLYDDRFPLLSKDMSRAEFERKISENTFNEHLFGAENTVIDKDLSFYNPDSEQITYMYYNPDADSGGQLVITNISYEQIIEASQRYSDNTSEFFDYIVSVGRQTAVDIDSEFFRDSLDKYNSNSHFAEGLTDDVKNQLTNIALSADTNFNQRGYYDSYSEIQSEHPDAIVLFRVGDFYEVLGENAQEAAEALNLTLMSRTINGEKIPMVGFPSSFLEDNENLLVENGHKIVTVEPENINSTRQNSINEDIIQELHKLVESHQNNIKKADNEKQTIVINAFAGPGAGKTTSCLEIAEKLKKQGYVTEYVQEYAKELVYDNNFELLDGSMQNQFNILKEQLRRVDRLYGKVDFIVTDAPLLLNLIYIKENSSEYKDSVTELFNEFDNYNYFVERDTSTFETEGRIHNLEQSLQIDDELKDTLAELNIEYKTYTHSTIDNIISDVIEYKNNYSVSAQLNQLNKAQEFAQQNDLPFSDKFSKGAEDDFDTAVYDGSMSADDYEKLKQAESHLASAYEYKIADINNIGNILRKQFASDEIINIAYAFGISNSSWFKDAHPRDTHENVTKRELRDIDSSVIIDGIKVKINTNDTGVIFSSVNAEYSYSWQEVAETFYSAVLNYTLDGMYSEIIAEAQDNKASVSTFNNVLSSEEYPIQNAREIKISNEYIQLAEDGKGYNLIGDIENGANENKGVIIKNFADEKELVNYLKDKKYLLNGYGINTAIFETESQNTPVIEPKTDRPTITCVWSEHPAFENGKTYSVADFDLRMKNSDAEWIKLRQQEIDTYGNDMRAMYQAYENGEIDGVHQGYAKVKFTVNMPNGTHYTERQDIGDGDGGVIDFLRKAPGYKNIIPLLEQSIKDEPSLLTPVYGEEFADEVLKSDNLSTKVPTEKESEIIFLSSEGNNYVISDDSFADGTKTERYANNINAIKTLKQLQEENRNATQAEQEILAKYVGWGGLDSYFKDENNRELKALLTDDEYRAAKASTLTSFYTPPAVIRAIYKTLNNLGFKTGNILEPSCGVGNFMGLIPQDMSDSKFYGVELDTISGNIASKLYPKANIAVQGYETSKLPDNFFDVAVGNVPFAQIKVLDKKYDKHNFLIHDYFFAKTLDKVRPGGIVAFVTSRGTMDKKSGKVRKYIAQRAELLGAIRLPNNTFSRTAGTEVTSDILILKKRERMVDIEPEWVHLDKDDNGIVINSYFVKHPEMILGEMKEVSGPHGLKPECIAYNNARLEDLLDEAVSNINGEYKAQEIETELDSATDDEELTIPAIPGVRNFSYTVVDGDIYYRTNSIMKKSVFSKTAEERVKGLIQVRDAVREVLDNQLEDMSDEDIKNAQVRLNRIYDNFIKKYGYINSKANMNAFKEDSAIQLVASLEEFDSEKNYKGKADIFSKRTIKPHKAVSSVDTAADALAVSIAEKAKVDLKYMSKLYNKPVEEIISELEGAIFNVPGTDEYQTADEYLSGNVREKLREALSYSYDNPEKYDSNITALKAVQPADLTASEIDVRLGATWLPTEVVRDFIFETLSTPYYMRDSINVLYSKYNSEWRITNKNFDKSVNAQNTYGTKRISAYKIIEDTLNLRDVKIFDTIYEDGKEKRVLNKSETAIAQSKQEMIKNRFSGWIFADRDRRERLCRIYNEKFNSIRPREYDGSFLVLEGMSNEIKLREHQLNAVAHAVYGGNTLLAHTVGAGKTFEMVAIAMESKRLGLCNKSLFVVPNHITEQFGIEFLQLYPAANILVATKKDFETQNRKKFCSRIATGDYDAVIIGHSQFEKIPMSIERQRQIIEMQIDEVINSIADAKNNNAENFTIKQLAKTQKNLEIRLEKLNDQSRKDDVVTFEELGVDRLFVDEAHYYKNLFLYTKMRNVAGIGQSEAQKSSDLFMKCRYLDELTEGKGVIFATGTPISNSMTELYTMQRYLQYNKLLEQGLNNFDAWASTYGETVTALELSPEGNGYRAKTRFAKFFNLPELMSSFREIADIKTADVLNLDVPKAERHNVLTKPSEQQKQILEGLADRAEKVRSNKVDPSTDNMLKITNDGRKLALDQRLINPMLPDDENSKLNACADNIFSLWDKTKADRLAQMVFCDISTPNGSGDFNVYDDLKDKLIKKGIPENEISFIHDAKTNIQKQDMFSKVRSGDIRVIIGSTSKMGAGTNCQDKLIALHHLDCPWRPADLQQREGRIVRQGNKNPVVQIFSYVTENTFDAYLYQLVENKQKFISQIMTSKSPVRSAEDIDETALSYSEIKALASGNPLIKEKMDLDVEVAKLRLLKANFLSVKYELEDKIASMYPLKISSIKYNIEKIEDDIKLAESHSDDEDFSLTLRGVTYTDKKEAGKQLLFACDKSVGSEKVRIGEYKGFILDLRFDSYHSNNYILTLNGKAHYDVELGMDTFGNITRMDNLLKSLPDRLQRVQN